MTYILKLKPSHALVVFCFVFVALCFSITKYYHSFQMPNYEKVKLSSPIIGYNSNPI